MSDKNSPMEHRGMEVAQIVRAATCPALATDENDLILAVNGAAEQLLGRAVQAVIGKVLQEVLDARDVFGNRVLVAAGIHRMVRGGEPVHAFQIDVSTASSGSTRLLVSVIPVLGPETSRYRLVYHLIPRRRRSRAEETIELLLKNEANSGLFSIAADRDAGVSEAPHLTRRERQVLQGFTRGHNVADTADSLHISVNTVRSHSRNIFRKLGAHSRAEAVSVAFHRGLV